MFSFASPLELWVKVRIIGVRSGLSFPNFIGWSNASRWIILPPCLIVPVITNPILPHFLPFSHHFVYLLKDTFIEQRLLYSYRFEK
jgi:hypothetical protein